MATTLPPDDVPLDASAPPAPAPADPRERLVMERRRRRTVWMAGVLALLLLAGLAAWLAHGISVDQRLQAVGKAAVLAAAVPPAAAPQPPAEPPAASLAAGETLVDPAALAATAAATTALAAGSGPDAVRPKGMAEGDEPVRKLRKKKTSRRQAAARAARDRTFVRCPPLGQQGAVMCRWHICNGGAGKEAACRPYLERKP